MRATRASLLAGALALAYKFCSLAELREGFRSLEGTEDELPDVLSKQGVLREVWAKKLGSASLLATRLYDEAIYGMVAIRNQLVGGQMLNACMEESKRRGYTETLPELLIERDLITEAVDAAIRERCDSVREELLAKQVALATAIDLQGDNELVDLELSSLLGEVAAAVSFLQRAELDTALRAQERAAQGLPIEVEAPTPPPQAVRLQAPEPKGPTPVDAGEEDPIRGYELLEKLGAGAMGAVLKAKKHDTGEIVALKILKPELSGDREYVERFLREAKAVARLNHRNIVRAVQVGRSGEYYFFAMEFLTGQTASDLIKAQGRLPERFALMVTRCIAAALTHAWQHQIVHRDIKPDNIMVTQDGQVKLTDLGLARTAKSDSTLTITGVVMGSPAYISPEQATGEKDLDSRSDIYALGATLYHMLTGEVPYNGDSPLHVMLRHMNDPLPDVRLKAPEVSEATRLVIQRMMAKRPEGRFQSAQQVEAATKMIEDALARGEVPQIPPGLAPVARPAPKPQAQQDPAASQSQDPSATSQSGEVDPTTPSGKKKRKKKKKKKKVEETEEQVKRREMGQRMRKNRKSKRRF
ncbi:MAG: protein kinase [Planctomycetes bacterium]|nr:protein kinase [Planctomycetota bacterium]